MVENHILDVRTIEPRYRHDTIFKKFEELESGSSIILVNDHDPKPLRYQFNVEYANKFSWQYLMSGPDEWKVEIKKTAAESKDDDGCCGCCGG